MRVLFGRLLAASSLCVLAAAGTRAEAQAAPAQSGAPPASGIGEIIVTAQKRSQDVEKVAATISAFSSQTLAERGVSGVAGLAEMVPSMQVGELAGATNVTMRGVGNNLFAVSGAPGVAINVDGVFLPIAEMGSLLQTDMSRVEVLEGPQGTLYGRNANAGAINFITQAPTTHFEGYAQAGYASYNTLSGSAVINAPLTDRVQARLALDWHDQQDGFVKNVVPGGQDIDKSNTVSGRLSVRAELTSDLTLDLVASQLHQTGPSNYNTLHNFPTPQAVAASPYFATAIVDTRPWKTSDNSPVSGQRDFSFGDATLTWKIGDYQLKSITGFTQSHDHYTDDGDGTNINAYVHATHFASNTISEEVDGSGPVGPLNLITGLFYMDEDYFFRSHFTFPLGLPGLPLPGSQLQAEESPLKTKAIAAFGDATWPLTKSLRLLGGVRVSRDTITEQSTNWVTIGTSPTPVFTCPNKSAEVEFTSTTWRAGVQYDVNRASNVYGTVSTGFKDGGFNSGACLQSYQPETVTSYEIGVKNRLLGNTLIFNADAFYYDYSNLQLVETVGLQTIDTNAASATIKGLEFVAQWEPDAHWSTHATLTFLDAQYSKFLNVDTLAPQLGSQDLSGHYLDNAPKESLNVGVAYRTDAYSFGRFTLEGDVSQRSKIYFREFNLPLDSQPGYTLLNFDVIWTSPDRKYQARFYGTNVTDKGYLTSMGSASTFGARFVNWGNPRQIGAELKVNF